MNIYIRKYINTYSGDYIYIYIYNHLPLAMYLKPSLDSKQFPKNMSTLIHNQPHNFPKPSYFSPKSDLSSALDKFGWYMVHYGY